MRLCHLSMVALVFGLLALTPQARAQEDDEAYRALIREAVTEFRAQRFAEARALFVRAHEASPSARTLRGIGLTSFEMRDYAVAHRNLNAALFSAVRPLSADQRTEVQELAGRCETFLGFYLLRTDPEDAEVLVDGAPPERDVGGRIVLAIGEHEVTVSAPGYETSQRAVRVIGGEQDSLTFELAPAGPSERRASERARTAPADAGGTDRTAAIALLVTGGIAGAASIVLGTTWWLYQDDQLARCETASCDNVADIEAARDAAVGTTVTLAIVGAALLTAGGALFAVEGDGEAAAAARCGPAGLGLVCSGRF